MPGGLAPPIRVNGDEPWKQNSFARAWRAFERDPAGRPMSNVRPSTAVRKFVGGQRG